MSANRNLPETRAVGKTTFVKCKRSQAAFAASSAYDRIAFARWNRSNRTVRVPSREKRQKTGPRRSTRHFLQCGSKARPTELPRFPSILAVIQPYFSATQTVWRREGDANPQYNLVGSPLPIKQGSQVGFAKSSVCYRQQFANEVCKSQTSLGRLEKTGDRMRCRYSAAFSLLGVS